MSYQRLVITGKLGGDPVLRVTETTNTSVCQFSVAYNSTFNDEKQTAWFRITTWGKLADACNQYLKKGSEVMVEGRLNFDPKTHAPKVWSDQQGVLRTSFEVTASHVEFLSLAPLPSDVEVGDCPF